jgi:hypothetical protein
LVSLEILSPTTKMASFCCCSKRRVIKSIKTPSYELTEICRILYSHIYLYSLTCFIISHKCALCLLSFQANKSFYLKSPLWFFFHNVLP